MSEEELKDFKKFNYISKGGLKDMEIIGNTFYIYGSEIACLRLYKFYTKPNNDYQVDVKQVDVDYSYNLKKWFLRFNLID